MRATTDIFGNIFRNKRILVTGNTGFKGSWLCEWLLQMNAKPIGFSLDVPTTPSLFENLAHRSRFPVEFGDVRKYSDVEKVISKYKPEIIFHLAAQSLVLRSYSEPLMTFDTNVMGTANVLEAFKNSKFPTITIIVTSDKCYENLNWLYSYRENDRLGGKDPYSASKGCAEIVTNSYVRSFLPKDGAKRVVSVRAGNVIGGGDFSDNRIVPDCARAWARRKAVEIRNPWSVRPWQHVLDCLKGYLAVTSHLLSSHELNHEAFNFGPPPQSVRSVKDLVDRLTDSWSGPARYKVVKTKTANNEAKLLTLTSEKALGLLDWRPTLAFDETVKFTSEWYQEFYRNRKKTASLTQLQIEEYCKRASYLSK